MSVVHGQTWKLDRYARFVYTDSNTCGHWQESHSLVNAQSYIRGLSRNNSLLFMCRLKTETRQFRVRFCEDVDVSGMEVCTRAISSLSDFFTIKSSNAEVRPTDVTVLDVQTKEEQSNPKISNVKVNCCAELCGEVTIGTIAQAVLDNRRLPLAYHHHRDQADMIPQLLVVCLADPAFPAFVETVEVALSAVIQGL